MNRDPVAVKQALNRLRRVRGQVDGIIAMIESQRECREVIQQIAAASKALDRAGVRLLVSQLQYCLLDAEGAEAAGYTEAQVERMFLQLA